jgi:hypothetical protein
MEIDMNMVGWIVAGGLGVAFYHNYIRTKFATVMRIMDDRLTDLNGYMTSESDRIYRNLHELEKQSKASKECCKDKNYYNSNS